ncbi:MAG: DUF4199 domain-containing protein [Chitinophagaceae bacterium]|nr:DUF4199 domain-containing protein [Chitinophagaceae bacterium]
MKLSPLIKGIITAVAMTGFSFFAYSNIAEASGLHYLVYLIYALGIVWALMAFRMSPAFTGSFKDSFSVGFRCFIIATLIMAVYTYTFARMHPEFAEKNAKAYKEQLVKEIKPTMPSDIEAMEKQVASYKKGYELALVYGSIFGYLIIGAGLTAIGSALLTRRT